MGVSFRVSKTGTRFRPRPIDHSETTADASARKEAVDNSKESSSVPRGVGSKTEVTPCRALR